MDRCCRCKYLWLCNVLFLLIRFPKKRRKISHRAPLTNSSLTMEKRKKISPLYPENSNSQSDHARIPYPPYPQEVMLTLSPAHRSLSLPFTTSSKIHLPTSSLRTEYPTAGLLSVPTLTFPAPSAGPSTRMVGRINTNPRIMGSPSPALALELPAAAVAAEAAEISRSMSRLSLCALCRKTLYRGRYRTGTSRAPAEIPVVAIATTRGFTGGLRARMAERMVVAASAQMVILPTA